jgi:hypothetical protein
MKFIFFVIICFLLLAGNANSNVYNRNLPASASDSLDDSKLELDGPYIIYRNGFAVIKQVLKIESAYYPTADSTKGSVKGRVITCYVNDSVSLQHND